MTNRERDQKYVVVWAGGEGLTAAVDTKPPLFWRPPTRLYNRTGKYSKKPKDSEDIHSSPSLIDPLEED